MNISVTAISLIGRSLANAVAGARPSTAATTTTATATATTTTVVISIHLTSLLSGSRGILSGSAEAAV